MTRKKNKLLRGFTVIEIIMVIAIIAILATIITVSINKYIVASKDATAIGDLSSLVTAGTIFFSSQGNYENWITQSGPAGIGGPSCSGDIKYLSICNALNKAGYVDSDYQAGCSASNSCNVESTKWCVSIKLKASNNTWYCVDSSGAKRKGQCDLPATQSCS